MSQKVNGFEGQLAKAGIEVKSLKEVCLGEDESDFDEDDDSGEKHKDPTTQFYILTSSQEPKLTVWEKARAIVDQTGYWPIISGEHEQLLEFWEIEESAPAEIIKLSQSVNATEWLNTKYQEELSQYKQVEEGTWPKGNIGPKDGLFHAAEGVILFCPTKTAWHVPALLKWGNGNDCIAPHEHTAVLKKWNSEYGAELVCVTNSVMEMRVAKPPQTEEAAMRLAREIFAYCPDMVTQRSAPCTIAALAADLFKDPCWYFWWD